MIDAQLAAAPRGLDVCLARTRYVSMAWLCDGEENGAAGFLAVKRNVKGGIEGEGEREREGCGVGVENCCARSVVGVGGWVTIGQSIFGGGCG